MGGLQVLAAPDRCVEENSPASLRTRELYLLEKFYVHGLQKRIDAVLGKMPPPRNLWVTDVFKGQSLSGGIGVSLRWRFRFRSLAPFEQVLPLQN
jgi:hypothetical protein